MAARKDAAEGRESTPSLLFLFDSTFYDDDGADDMALSPPSAIVKLHIDHQYAVRLESALEAGEENDQENLRDADSLLGTEAVNALMVSSTSRVISFDPV